MPQTLLDSSDTGDITLDRPSPYYRTRRRTNPMLWWYASAIITTVAFLLVLIAACQYASLRGTTHATWDVLRMMSGTLSVATIAIWTAAALARLVIARARKLTELMLDMYDAEGRYVQGFADGAVGKAGRLKSVDRETHRR